MGKKKGTTNTADNLKDQGNKAFVECDFQKAIDLYTQAIDKSKGCPNHIYFANRANVFLEIGENQKAIDDCQLAIQIDKTFIKAYFRLALAQFSLEQTDEASKTIEQAMKTIKKAIEINESHCNPRNHPNQ